MWRSDREARLVANTDFLLPATSTSGTDSDKCHYHGLSPRWLALAGSAEQVVGNGKSGGPESGTMAFPADPELRSRGYNKLSVYDRLRSVQVRCAMSLHAISEPFPCLSQYPQASLIYALRYFVSVGSNHLRLTTRASCCSMTATLSIKSGKPLPLCPWLQTYGMPEATCY